MATPRSPGLEFTPSSEIAESATPLLDESLQVLLNYCCNFYFLQPTTFLIEQKVFMIKPVRFSTKLEKQLAIAKTTRLEVLLRKFPSPNFGFSASDFFKL